METSAHWAAMFSSWKYIALYISAAAGLFLFLAGVYERRTLRKSMEAVKSHVREQVRSHPTDSKRPRCYHAIVNPASGKKQGERVWNAIHDVLKHADPKARVNTLFSDREGHERDIAAALARSDEVQHGDVIIVVGGDGFLFEVVDNLIRHNSSSGDKDHLYDHPLCVVPAGTGNGVATSLKLLSAAQSTVAMLTSEPGTFNLMKVILGDDDNEESKRNSALSIGWGAIADHDYYSEGQYRWLGEARLLIIPMGIIAVNNCYRGRITFTPHHTQDMDKLKAEGVSITQGSDGQHKCEVVDDYFIVHAVNVPWMASDSLVAPKCKHDDNCIHVVVCRKISRLGALQLFLQFSDGRHEEQSSEVSIYRTTEFSIEPIDPEPVQHNFAIDGQCVSATKVRGSIVEKGIKMFHAVVE